MAQAERINDLERAVDRILAFTGAHVVAALPLGLGKPNRLLNTLYQRVAADTAMSLTLYTALTLTRPAPARGLEGRFANPFVARHFGDDYPDLGYAIDLRARRLPPNVRVHEFYLLSGSLLGVERAQRDYASLNYTHVAREVAARGVNLVLQQIARRGDRISLSSNPDVTLDLLDRIAAEGRPKPLVVGVVHPLLPFLGNDAELPLDALDVVVEEDAPPHALFALPREPVQIAEFALGLQASTLVRDGGTLQIGIGALSDALVHALLLRQRDNPSYRGVLTALWQGDDPAEIVGEWGGLDPFERGLYGASEMVMDGFMHLRRAGILRRLVYDDLALQRLLNDGRIGDELDRSSGDALLQGGVVGDHIDRTSLAKLLRFGVLPAGSHIDGEDVVLPNGSRFGTDLARREHRELFAQAVAGQRLQDGRYLHGAFWLGSKLLHQWLATLEGEDYSGLCMTRVSHINELYGGQEQLHVAQRHDARFFNTCMMHTLLGAAVSDALDTGQVVSGVGGQYNFVAMAHALPDGRSALMLRATRDARGRLQSNIVWNYGHTTIPRHLRDLVITEYGIADLRGCTDEEAVQRMLAIADSRFQDTLLAEAQRAGKVDPAWRIPEAQRRNTPARLAAALKPHAQRGLFPTFPFGTEFDDNELRLIKALKRLKAATATRTGTVRSVLAALLHGAARPEHGAPLARMGLQAPGSLADRIEARLLVWALRSEP